MRLLMVEDEAPNLQLLSGMIAALRPTWTVAHTADSVRDTVEWLRQNSPDLILMDVLLADGLCFSIFEMVRVESPIIFTTAYDSYAIQAFRVNSVDYLLKPIKEAELRVAIERFEQRQRPGPPGREVDYPDILHAIRAGVRRYRTRFLIQGASAYHKLDVSSIAYFYTTNRVTFAVEYTRREHPIDLSLDALEEELHPEEFFRANRQTILHVNAIQKIEDYFNGKLHVTLVPPLKVEVIISRLRNSAFKAWMGR